MLKKKKIMKKDYLYERVMFKEGHNFYLYIF
jgi:hypothetical protein